MGCPVTQESYVLFIIFWWNSLTYRIFCDSKTPSKAISRWLLGKKMFLDMAQCFLTCGGHRFPIVQNFPFLFSFFPSFYLCGWGQETGKASPAAFTRLLMIGGAQSHLVDLLSSGELSLAWNEEQGNESVSLEGVLQQIYPKWNVHWGKNSDNPFTLWLKKLPPLSIFPQFASLTILSSPWTFWRSSGQTAGPHA